METIDQRAHGVTRWRGLIYFWTTIVEVAITGAALLQVLGPPLEDPGRTVAPAGREQALAPDIPTPPAGALEVKSASKARPTNDGIPALPSGTETQISQNQLELASGDNRAETVPDAVALLPNASPQQSQRANQPIQPIERPDQSVQAAESVQEPPGAQQFTSDPAPAPPQVSSNPAADPGRNGGRELSIYYSNGSLLASTQAKELAGRFASRFHYTEMHGETDIPQVATVRFFSSDDRSTARLVRKVLADMHYKWRIENHSVSAAASQRGSIEVWIPGR